MLKYADCNPPTEPKTSDPNPDRKYAKQKNTKRIKISKMII